MTHVVTRRARPLAAVVVGLCVTFAPRVAAAAADHIKLFVLAGQSNMVGKGIAADLPKGYPDPQDDVRFACRIIGHSKPVKATWGEGWTTLRTGTGAAPHGVPGFGPEIGFGRAIADAYPKDHIAIIKFARSGANLYEMFNPDATTGLQLYPKMIDYVREQIRTLKDAGHDVEIAGFVWYQGEADTASTEEHANAYADNLKLLISRVRKDLGVPDLPFVAVRVNPHLERHVHAATVRAAIQHVTESDGHAAWIDIDDLNLPDHLHLDAASQIEAGKRLAHAWQNVVAGAATKPSAPRQ
jgi:hypothetical protein